MWTARDAWTYLAKHWGAGSTNKEGALILRVRCPGLCASIDTLHYQGKIDLDVSIRMQLLIRAVPRPERAGYKWPRTTRGAQQRAAFCRKMAGKVVQ